MTTLPASRLNGNSDELLNSSASDDGPKPLSDEWYAAREEEIDFSAEPIPYQVSDGPKFRDSGIDEDIEIVVNNTTNDEEARLKMRAFLREYGTRLIRTLRRKGKELNKKHAFPESLIYVTWVPRTWEAPAFSSVSPKHDRAMSYRASAECAAVMNRELMRENDGIVRVWTLCIPHKKKYSTLRITLQTGWAPKDEYDMPPTDFVERCCLSDLKDKLTTINKVISKFNPRKHSARWAVAACRIHPDDVQAELDRKQAEKDKGRDFYGQGEEGPFSVMLENGQSLRYGYDREEASSFVHRWNMVRDENEPRAFVEPMNPKPIKSKPAETSSAPTTSPVEGRYDVVTSAGQILQTGITQSQADRYMDLHNSLSQNAETMARVELSVM